MTDFPNFKIIALLSILLITGCKKKENPASKVEHDQSVPCFNAYYNGAYKGSGFTASSTYTYGILNVSRVNCQTVSLNLGTNTGSTIHEQATQLVITGSGNYEGKLSNGNTITISPGGSAHLHVVAVGSFTFNGDKQ